MLAVGIGVGRSESSMIEHLRLWSSSRSSLTRTGRWKFGNVTERRRRCAVRRSKLGESDRMPSSPVLVGVTDE